MEENYFATSRNGHELKDMYNPETNTLDIRSNGMYPSNVLSNLCSNGFRFDGVVCSSMEGFLQSLKQHDLDKQRQICSMKGGNARKKSVTSWQTDQIVWWKGQAINRQSEEYQLLIRKAYKAMFDQSERFRTALMSTRGVILVHTTGEESSYKTILTPKELCGILTEMRDAYDSIITKAANVPMIRLVETGAQCLTFAIHPSLLIDNKLVIRTDAVQTNLLVSHEGLHLEAFYMIEDGMQELRLSPMPSDDRSTDYTICAKINGGCFVAFYTENGQGNRQIVQDFKMN